MPLGALRRRARRAWASCALIVAAGLLSACGEQRPPNLILVSIDTLRPDHLSAYGYHRDTSPALSEIAADGVRFTAAFAQAPWTVPSHASLLTGRYPCVHGATATSAIAPPVPRLAERLRAAGYRTAGFVQTPYLGRKYGFARGFERFKQTFYGDARMRARVLALLANRKNDEAPFFLFWHIFDVHGPYDAPERLRARYRPAGPSSGPPDATITFLRGVGYHDYLGLERYPSLEHLVADYDAGIREADEQLAALVAALRRLHLYDDSVIVVTSDHGESLFDHQIWVGHGLFLYDDEIRVPLVIKPARHRPVRPVVDTIVESVDIVPTVMELLGQPVPADVDGQSLGRLIRAGDGSGLREEAFGVSSNLGGTPYLRTRRWKYIGSTSLPAAAILAWHLRPGAGVAVADRLVLGEQLFDLESDPGERRDVVREQPEAAATLRGRLAAILERCVPAANRGGPDVFLDEDERERLRALGYVH